MFKKTFIITAIGAFLLTAIILSFFYFGFKSVYDNFEDDFTKTFAYYINQEIQSALELGLAIDELDELNFFCEKNRNVFGSYFDEVFIVNADKKIIGHSESGNYTENKEELLKNFPALILSLNKHRLTSKNLTGDNSGKQYSIFKLEDIKRNKNYFLILVKNNTISRNSTFLFPILISMILISCCILSVVVLFIYKIHNLKFKNISKINQNLEEIIFHKNFNSRLLPAGKTGEHIQLTSMINVLLEEIECLQDQNFELSRTDSIRFKKQTENLNSKMLEMKINFEESKKNHSAEMNIVQFQFEKISILLKSLQKHFFNEENICFSNIKEFSEIKMELHYRINAANNLLEAICYNNQDNLYQIENSNFLDILNSALDNFNSEIKERNITVFLDFDDKINYSITFPKKAFYQFVYVFLFFIFNISKLNIKKISFQTTALQKEIPLKPLDYKIKKDFFKLTISIILAGVYTKDNKQEINNLNAELQSRIFNEISQCADSGRKLLKNCDISFEFKKESIDMLILTPMEWQENR